MPSPRRLLAGTALVLAVGILGSIASACDDLKLGQTAPGPAAISAPAKAHAADTGQVQSIHDDCSVCHVDDRRVVAVKPMPQIPHQVEAWTQCSFCHGDSR